ncbi:unnamed protein product [Caenorhabditis sp. 36 PRJEB53466]|nr:unnamed protein product [Caenorhabditis sp. 36 PRJEB53466]
MKRLNEKCRSNATVSANYQMRHEKSRLRDRTLMILGPIQKQNMASVQIAANRQEKLGGQAAKCKSDHRESTETRE